MEMRNEFIFTTNRKKKIFNGSNIKKKILFLNYYLDEMINTGKEVLYGMLWNNKKKLEKAA
ncbi:hypothetical protein C1646_774940 [Rhizophagus diaphanus]|nr:hypothetical protein C1646_774940 [Rhizophagus diaphanus] [Rhizophagus sp. MUCL 43196]